MVQMLKDLRGHQIWKQIQYINTDLKPVHIYITYFKYVLSTNFLFPLKIPLLGNLYEVHILNIQCRYAELSNLYQYIIFVSGFGTHAIVFTFEPFASRFVFRFAWDKNAP